MKTSTRKNASAKEELLRYIDSLTPEKLEIVINRIPEWFSAAVEQERPDLLSFPQQAP